MDNKKYLFLYSFKFMQKIWFKIGIFSLLFMLNSGCIIKTILARMYPNLRPSVTGSEYEDITIKDPLGIGIISLEVWSNDYLDRIWEIESYPKYLYKTINIEHFSFQKDYSNSKVIHQNFPEKNKLPRTINIGEKIAVQICYWDEIFVPEGTTCSENLLEKTNNVFVLVKDNYKIVNPAWDSLKDREKDYNKYKEYIKNGNSIFLEDFQNPHTSPERIHTINELISIFGDKKYSPEYNYVIIKSKLNNSLDLRRIPGFTLNNVKDISVLEDFKEITSLDINYSEINDVSVLSKLSNLEYFGIYECNFKNFQSIKELPKLRRLNVYNTPINNFQFLNNSHDLEGITFIGSNLNDSINFDIFSKLKNVTFLELSHNQFQTANNLKVFSNIKTLRIDNNKLETLDFISYFPKLNELSAGSNNLKDISALLKLTNDQFKPNENGYIDVFFRNDQIPESQVREVKEKLQSDKIHIQ